VEIEDIDKVEVQNYLKMDHIEFERIYENYCCGEFFTILCGFGKHVIISHFWNTGNKQILKL
jgi:hypothetical protein